MNDKVAQPRPERKAVLFEFKFAENAAPGVFEGYGSVAGNEDDYGDVIQNGAFAGVLARHQTKGTMPKMLLNHGSMGSMFGGDPMADLPIGKWTSMSEDAKGLECKGRLINLDTESGKRIYGAMKEGELGGLSIGYRAGDFVRGTKPNEPRRTIKSIKDLLEVSPVTFPANEMATIGSIKGAGLTEREFERLLTRDAGLSRSEALVVINRGVKAYLAMRDAGDDQGLTGLLEQLRSTRKLLTIPL
jgi:HK97 family phage prohead protease